MHDCVDSVGDCQHGAVVEALLYAFFKELFSLHVDVGSGFVHQDDFRFANHRSSHADQLPFSETQILASLVDHRVQSALAKGVELRFEVDSLQSTPDFLRGVLAKRVDVLFDCATE